MFLDIFVFGSDYRVDKGGEFFVVGRRRFGIVGSVRRFSGVFGIAGGCWRFRFVACFVVEWGFRYVLVVVFVGF